MKRVVFLLLICVFFLSACSGGTSSDLFALPKIPETQKALVETVESVLGGGYDYAEPRAGLNRQSLQLMDIDGDGDEEGIAFLRDISETYKTFIYIFEKNEKGFTFFDVIEGSERELRTVSYASITGRGGYEIVVEWGADGDDAHPITVYGINSKGSERLLEISANRYSVSDIDANGKNELVAVTASKGIAEVYTENRGKIEKTATVNLAKNGGRILAIKTGRISERQNGVFIERRQGAGTVTDVIAFDGREYKNLLPGGAFRKTSALSTSIGADGIIKIPEETENQDGEGRLNGTYRWRTVSGDGLLSVSAFTYHEYTGGWYITMPSVWSESVHAESRITRSGETTISFETQEEMQGDTDDIITAPLFNIYVLNGADRKALAMENGRFIIAERDGTIFAASVSSESYLATAINEDFLKSAFRSIESEWFSEILFA